MAKNALFVFNGDPMCFIHVLLNALEMKNRGDEVKVILEGASVKLLPELIKPGNPLNGLWNKSLEAGVIDGVCKACAKNWAPWMPQWNRKCRSWRIFPATPAWQATRKKGSLLLPFDNSLPSIGCNL